MRGAGFNVVRMGDLSWDSFEPPGRGKPRAPGPSIDEPPWATPDKFTVQILEQEVRSGMIDRVLLPKLTGEEKTVEGIPVHPHLTR